MSIRVLAGESFDYVVTLPDNHLPGTHWLHPHRHGAVASQVGGGAAAAVIVKDTPLLLNNELPSYLADAREEILILQQFADREVLEIHERAIDLGLIEYSPSPFVTDELVLVNGQHQPFVKAVNVNEWIRFRVINSNVEREGLGIHIELADDNRCEMLLVAKDGIYVPRVPRVLVEGARIVPGGRADLLVRCGEGGGVGTSDQFPLLISEGTPVLLMEQLVASTTNDEDIVPESWAPNFPAYLQDLQDTPAPEACSCTTILDDGAVNGREFQHDFILHTSPLGSVVERDIEAEDHPYHQHIYPFQLVELENANRGPEGYIQTGDWHDTFEGNALIRYQPQTFQDKIVLHCHRLEHEDEGMMSLEQIVEPEDQGGMCTCGAAPENSWPVWSIVLTAVLGVAAVLGVSWYVVRRRRHNEGESRREAQSKEEGIQPGVDAESQQKTNEVPLAVEAQNA